MVTKSLDKNKILNIVYDFFKQFQTWCGPSAITPSVNELEKFFSKNLQMFNNGQLVVKNAANYLDRLQKFQKKYSSFKISEPLEDPLMSDNQVAVYYQLDLTTQNGQHKQIFIMGLFTIEDNKISRWIEVTQEKGAGNWDA
jgi:predicted alternative tryptophan synthase beta-subunit